jgi:hypothetical protein
MKVLPRRGLLLLATALFLCLPVLGASAAPPPGSYFQGFESNTAGWFNFVGATVTRVPSGSVSTYANGVAAASGSYYARLGKEPPPPHDCGGKPWFVGPYTDFGGDTSAFFPPGGYSTGVDIYLDVQYAQTHPDTRFDWSSEINDTTGSFRRDFVFNVGTDATGFVITGGNNANRCSADPYTFDPSHGPRISVTVSGWYTFKHIFTGVPGGPLTVILQLINQSTNAVIASWVRSDPSDIIGTTVGGSSDGWFVQNEFDGLAIDNTFRTGIVSTPGCEIKISDGGHITALNTDQGSFGGNAKVSLSGDSTGNQTYHDHGPIEPLDFKALTIDAVICSDDRTSAELYGRGSVDGSGSYEYRIRLEDNGEPGTSDKYGITIAGLPFPHPGTYASGDQTLDGGNIQIR